MNQDDQTTTLQNRLAEANAAIRELNERASSHLITMMNAVQRLKLENDRLRAELRSVGQYKLLMDADKEVRKNRHCIESYFQHPESFLDFTVTNNRIGKITAPQKL